MNELDHFLKQYEAAANSCNFDNVEPLIADNAVFWFTNGTYRGKAEIRKAFEDTWAHITDETYSITDVEWGGVSADLAVCTYSFTSDGRINGKRQVDQGGPEHLRDFQLLSGVTALRLSVKV